jgi:hypothetical protein
MKPQQQKKPAFGRIIELHCGCGYKWSTQLDPDVPCPLCGRRPVSVTEISGTPSAAPAGRE